MINILSIMLDITIRQLVIFLRKKEKILETTDKKKIKMQFAKLKKEYKPIPTFIKDRKIYDDLSIEFSSKINTASKFIIFCVENEMVVRNILNYKFVQNIDFIREWLENILIILNFAQFLIHTLTTENLSNELFKEIRKSILDLKVLFDSLKIQIEELTWLNEIFLSFIRLKNIKRFYNIEKILEKDFMSMISQQKFVVLKLNRVIERISDELSSNR